MFEYIVKERPVCVHCSKKCGRRHCPWPKEQKLPSPWDRKSWTFQYNPFCTLRCAFAYARRAYAQGTGHEKLRQK